MLHRALRLAVGLLLWSATLAAQTPDMIWMSGGGHFGAVAIASSRDGSRVGTADQTGRAHLRDASTGATLARFRYEWSDVVETFFTDGETELVVVTDDSVHLWTIESRAHRAFAIVAPVGAFRSGSDVVAVARDGVARTYALSSGALIALDTIAGGGIGSVRALESGGIVAFESSDGAVRAYDLRARRRLPLAVPPVERIRPPFLLAASATADIVAALVSDTTIGLWSARTGGLIDSVTLPSLYDASRRHLFEPEEMIIRDQFHAGVGLDATGEVLGIHMDLDARIYIVDRRRDSVLQSFDDGFAHTFPYMPGLAGEMIRSTPVFSADGRSLFVVAHESTFDFGHQRTDRSLARFGIGPNAGRIDLTANELAVTDVALAADGRRATTIAGPTRMTWSIPEGALTRVERLSAPLIAYIAQSPDGERLATYSGWFMMHGPDGELAIEGFGHVRSGPIDLHANELAISPASRYALVRNRLYHPDGMQELPLPPYRATLFSYDTLHLAVWTRDSLFIWNCRDRTRTHALGIDGSILAAAFSRTGQSIAVGLGSGDIVVIDVGTGAERARLAGHDSAITALSFARGDAFLVSAATDATMRTWEIATRRIDYSYTGYPGVMLAIDATSDGQMILSGTDEGTVILWHGRGAIASSDDAAVEPPSRPTIRVTDGRLVVAIEGARDLTVDLYDIDGKLAARAGAAAGPISLDVSQVPPGTYVARVVSNGNDACSTVIGLHGR